MNFLKNFLHIFGVHDWVSKSKTGKIGFYTVSSDPSKLANYFEGWEQEHFECSVCGKKLLEIK